MAESSHEETTKGSRQCRRCEIPNSAIIVASAFIINTIYGGLSYTPGLYLNSLLEEYKAGKSVTTWAISIQGSIMYFSGIIGGPLVDRYGTRVVAMAGAFCSTAGYLLSGFSPNVELLYLTYGVITGVGYGMLMISNNLAVQQHTTTRRALAAGFALIGSGLGAFVMPLVTKWAIVSYGWRGSMVFLSGLLLNTLPCALLLRPHLPVPPPPDTKPEPTNLVEDKQLHIAVEHAGKSSLTSSIAKLYRDNLAKSRVTMCSSTMTVAGSLRQRTISAGSTFSLPVVFTSTLSINKLNYLSAVHLDSDIEPGQDVSSCWSRFKTFFLPALEGDQPLLTPVTILGIVSWFFYFAGMPVLYVFMPVRATTLGFEISVGATLMSLTGIGEVSGRLAGALLGTLHEKLPLILYSTTVMLAGGCTAAIVLCTTYSHMVAACIGYGIAMGVSASMSTTALRDLVGINRLPWMVGMAFTFGGFGNLLSIQAIAYAWEQSGSLFIPYLIGGALLVVCGLNMFGAKLVKEIPKDNEPVTLAETEMFVP